MQEQERMSGALQENVLTLLCFGADTCKIIRNSVTSKLFESSIYRDIASHAIDFIDQFQQPIGAHLPDVLEHVLKGDDKRKAAAYEKVLENLFLASSSINSEYVISRLNEFVRGQSIKAAIVKAVEAIERNDIINAELELTKGMKAQAVSFEGGTVFSDPEQSLKFLNHQEESFLTGIHELDKREASVGSGHGFHGSVPLLSPQLMSEGNNKRR